MSNIYDQHQTAFKGTTAYVILKDGERVATAAFKWGAAVTCYFHIIGIEMTKGRACGGGYDRASAAAYAAILKVKMLHDESKSDIGKFNALHVKIAKALYEGSEGSHWDRALTDAGFTVYQAV